MAKITGTLKNGGTTFNITKVTDGSIDYDATASDMTVLFSTADGTYSGYNEDIYSINAGAVKTAVVLNASDTNLQNVTLGSGNDTIRVISGSNSEYLKVATGAGKDVVEVESNTTVTLTDFDSTKDVIKFGSNLEDLQISGAQTTGKTITLTLGTVDGKKSEITINNGLDKKITIQDNSGNTVYEDTFSIGQDKYKEITNTTSGKAVTSDSQYIDASERKTPLDLTVNYRAGGQEVVGGSGADTIRVVTSTSYAEETNTLNIQGGKGADVFVIGTDAGVVNITDYTAGNKTTADKIYLKDGLQIKEGKYSWGDVILTATDTNNHTVTINLSGSASWNQVAKEDQSLVWVTNSDSLDSIKGTAAYYDTTRVVITDNKAVKDFIKANTYIDLDASVKSAQDKKESTFDFFGKTVSTDTSVTFDFSNIAGPVYIKNNNTYVKSGEKYSVIASKGKDTFEGSGSFTGVSGTDDDDNDIEVAGNKYIIASGEKARGGKGNDTLRSTGDSTSFNGGGGNDVFLLSGEGGANVDGYFAGAVGYGQVAKDIADEKKAKGSDKIVVSFDKWNKAGVAIASITDGVLKNKADSSVISADYEKDSNIKAGDAFTFQVNVAADLYHDSISADANASDVGLVGTNVEGKVGQFIAAGYGSFTNGTNTSTKYVGNSSYTFNLYHGQAVSLQDQGITYNETVSASTDTVTTKANYHGVFAPNAVSIVADSSANKAVRLVAGSANQALVGASKNDTLVGKTGSKLAGGAGNDVFMGGGIIEDYSNVKNNADKIIVTNGFGTDHFSLSDGKVNLDGFTFNMTTADVVLNKITETPKKKYEKNSDTLYKYTGTTKTTDAMIRAFGQASSVVAAGKGSTEIYTYADLDSGVAVIDASKTGKNTQIVNGAEHVVSIVGSAKNDTITVGTLQTNYDDTTKNAKYYGDNNSVYMSDVAKSGAAVTVATGKGNDVIWYDSTANVYISDFTTAKETVNRTTGKRTKITGDAIYFDGSASDVTKALASTEHASGGLSITFDGNDVKFGNTTLKDMRGKNLFVYTTLGTDSKAYDDAWDVANGTLVTLNNVNELVATKNDKGTGNSPVVLNSALGVTRNNALANVSGLGESDITMVDATAVVAGAKIEAGSFITQISAGKGADTIVAGTGTTVVESGLGNDIFQFTTASFGTADKEFKINDYLAADRILLGDGVKVSGATEASESTKEPTSVTKRGTTTTTYYSDTTLTLTDGTNTKTIKFYGLAADDYKITRQIGEGRSATTFALDYFSTDVTVGASDGASIDFTGANAKEITVNDKRTKAVTLEGIKGETKILGSTSKGAITFIGAEVARGADQNTAAKSAGVIFNGGTKADIYEGHGASDTVIFSVGNNTVLGGGRAVVTFGSGNDVAVVKASDTFTLNSYASGKDVIVLDTVFGGIDDFVGATKREDDDHIILTFGTKDDSKATIDFGTGFTDKVTIKMGTAKGGKLQAGATIFQGGFGTSISFADADGTTINAQYNPFATAITADSNAKGNHWLTVGTYTDTKVTAITGGKGKDTLVANGGVANLTGAAGDDTFIISSDTNVTITDFNTGKDVLDITGLALEDYGANYSFSGKDLIITNPLGGKTHTITLKNVVDDTKGVTSAIRYTSSDSKTSKTGVVLSDKVKVSLAANATKTDFTASYFTDTTTFDASKVSTNLTATFGTNLTKYTGSKKNDTVTFDSGATVELTYTGGTDVYTNVDKVSLKFSDSKWSISGAESSGISEKHVKLNIWESRTKTETIELTAKENTFTFSTSDYAQVDSSAKKKSDITGVDNDSGTTVYQYSASLLVSGKSGSGIDKVTYGFTTTADYYGSAADAKAGTNKITKASYEERFFDEYSVITAPETLFGGSEFDEVLPAKAEIEVQTADLVGDLAGGFKAGDIVTPALDKSKKTE